LKENKYAIIGAAFLITYSLAFMFIGPPFCWIFQLAWVGVVAYTTYVGVIADTLTKRLNLGAT